MKLARSLATHGGDLLATSGALGRLVRLVDVCGFHLATLDLRQNSDVHARVVGELLRVAGVESDYAGLDEAARVALLDREAAGFAIARDLINVRFPVPLAAKIGRILTYRTPEPDALVTGTPAELAMLAPEPGSGIMQDRMAWRIPGSTRSEISIPVGRIWVDITEKARGLPPARAA